jgi:hypothetical protein
MFPCSANDITEAIENPDPTLYTPQEIREQKASLYFKTEEVNDV